MDLLYCASWLYSANRRLTRRNVDLENMVPSSSGVGRLLVALAVIAGAVGFLGHASGARLNAAATAHLGEAK